MASPKSKKDEIREAAEADLEAFIRLVHPNRVLGNVHVELIGWMTRQEALTHQLVLLPRDHQKSAIAAYYTAWMITRRPEIRVLYISSTANLAIKQLGFIKDILTSDIYRRYWPEMVNLEEAKRTKWTETEIAVDHPTRRYWNVRDPTVFTAGLTTTITGLHADLIVVDDVVVPENAYTEDGRDKVSKQYGFLSSIGTTPYRMLVVGTRYHPKDLYDTLINRQVLLYDDDGEYVGAEPLFEKFERQVEVHGEFLWPKQLGPGGRWFGFDRKELERKRAGYLDPVQFRAQYYNDPNDVEGAGVKRDYFQYYDRKHLSRSAGYWYYKGVRLNIFAAVDFAYSTARRSDYTAIVVVAVDSNQNYYVLDIDRFKSDGLISEYFKHILALHQKWDFRKIRAEVTAAQKSIVKELKQAYILRHGLALSVEDYNPPRDAGNKAERIKAILQPRYAERMMWHYQEGNCQLLEEELVLQNPPHDDIKDALAAAIDGCVAPSFQRRQSELPSAVQYHTRFGGVL